MSLLSRCPLSIVSPRADARARTRRTCFLLRTRALPAVCSRHGIAHTRATRALSSPIVSAQQKRQRREARARRAGRGDRAAALVVSSARYDPRAEENPNRTGAHRGHLCSHVTIGTARPAMHGVARALCEVRGARDRPAASDPCYGTAASGRRVARHRSDRIAAPPVHGNPCSLHNLFDPPLIQVVAFGSLINNNIETRAGAVGTVRHLLQHRTLAIFCSPLDSPRRHRPSVQA